MAFKRDKLWKYSPVWVVLFSTGATLLKRTGERYLLHKDWDLRWSDLGTALGGALIGYGTFRLRYGNKSGGVVTR